MHTAAHIDALSREGALLVEAAERAGPDAPTPTCPEWTVRDLLRHIGDVHRWATSYLTSGRTERLDPADAEGILGTWPADDADLVPWFQDGHARLVQTLRETPEDLTCYQFITGLPARAFWARRQAHETAMHRVDVDHASGESTPFEPELAADGIDELLAGFVTRPASRLRADPPRRLHVSVTDAADGDWVVRINPDSVETVRRPGAADCTLRGSASDLCRFLWTRPPAREPEVVGDASVLTLWQDSVRVRWG